MGGPGPTWRWARSACRWRWRSSLQLLAPRGSREGLRTRLGESGQGSLVVLLCGLLLASAVLVGLMAGPLAEHAVRDRPGPGRPARRLAVGPALVGRRTDAAAVLCSSAAGSSLGDVWCRLPDARPPVSPEDLAAATRVWADAWPILRDFPVLGTGLGSFASVFPFYKSQRRGARRRPSAACCNGGSRRARWAWRCSWSRGSGVSPAAGGGTTGRDGGPLARLRLDRRGGRL